MSGIGRQIVKGSTIFVFRGIKRILPSLPKAKGFEDMPSALRHVSMCIDNVSPPFIGQINPAPLRITNNFNHIFRPLNR